MKESVYIETTIISYLTAWLSRDLIRAAHQQITQDWWKSRRADFELFISEFVISEIAAGDPTAAGERLKVAEEIPLLEISSDVQKLSADLLTNRAVPKKAATDATHIAMAAVHNIDYLLTWNCRHIANAEMQSAIERVCRGRGVNCPKICTPEELLGGDYDVDR